MYCQDVEPTTPAAVVILDDPSQMLEKRDRLLESTAKATNALLTLENLDEAVTTALKLIGEGIGCDIVIVLENVFESSSSLPSHCHFIYEWAMPDYQSLVADFRSTALPAELLGLAFLKQYFLEGNGFGGPVDRWDEPLRSWLASMQIQSAYSVPIRVNGQWWGVLCLDYCRAPTPVIPAEVAVLMAIADCIGSAIQRDRLKQEHQQTAQQRVADLEAYNRMLQGRDRLFEATAQAANVLLTLENFDQAVNTALKFIGEGIGCDCVVVLENMFEGSSVLPKSCDFLYEWAAPGFLPISVTFGSTCLPDELLGLEFMKQYFLEGEGFGGLVEAWNEPLRSALASVQIQSTYAVPIRVNGEWWGVLSLDYCRTPIQVSAAEISVLRAIADCIGSAIQRDRTQKVILQTEQTRVAELIKANTALKQSLDILAADSDLDRFIGNTLQLIAQQFDSPWIEYWVYPQPVGQAYIHLTYWHGQLLSASSGPSPNASSSGMIPFLDIPLSIGDTTIGAVAIYLSTYRIVSRQTIELAQALAQQLTLAVELSRLAEEAQQAALLQERTRMAREIHDTLAQAFGGILMQIQAANYLAATQPDKAQTHLLTAQALAKEGLAEARRSVWTLYLDATEYEDLARAIAKFIQQTSSSQSVPINLEIDGTPYHLHPDLGLNLLRIAQESITNALRHAQAQSIQITLSYSSPTVQLRIDDDGCGFDPQAPTHGFGLLGMQQRAARIGATWHLISHTGQGTTITVTLAHSQTSHTHVQS
jgi:signal transduction histidine kinase